MIVPNGAQAFLQTINIYGFLAGAKFVAGQAFTLTKEFTVDMSQDNRLRVQSNQEVLRFRSTLEISSLRLKKHRKPNKEVYHEAFTSGKGLATQSGGASLTPSPAKFLTAMPTAQLYRK